MAPQGSRQGSIEAPGKRANRGGEWVNLGKRLAPEISHEASIGKVKAMCDAGFRECGAADS